MAEEQESSSLTGEIETLRRPLRYYQEYDQLTGTFNKAAFCKKGSELLSASYDGLFDVVCIDIERFKLVNDIYGMKRDDSLLCHVARGLERKFGPGDGILALNTNEQPVQHSYGRLWQGYSSLNMLKDIDVNGAYDRHGHGFFAPQKSRYILKSVMRMRMAKWLNLPMIAEDAETKDQVDLLLTIGCVYAQGHYYYRR